MMRVLINFFDHEGVLLENLWTGVRSGARLTGVRFTVYEATLLRGRFYYP